MTSEEKVKRVYPDAEAVYSICRISIMADGRELGCRVGYNRSTKQAWADAWRNIQAQQSAGGNAHEK